MTIIWQRESGRHPVMLRHEASPRRASCPCTDRAETEERSFLRQDDEVEVSETPAYFRPHLLREIT